MQSRLIKLIITVSVVAGGIGFLVYSSMGSTQYYKMVDELTADDRNWDGVSLRVHGFVEPGSIDERIVNQNTTRTFVLEHRGKSIKVTHSGPVPDTFKDKSEVVAKGKLIATADGNYIMEANELMAKCPSKYEGMPIEENFGRSDGSGQVF
ncbi:MAG: cytochrome c maturation protein CcmE [Myxococcota bacterium]